MLRNQVRVVCVWVCISDCGGDLAPKKAIRLYLMSATCRLMNFSSWLRVIFLRFCFKI